MYALGLGGPKDPVEAYVWYSAAITGGDADIRAQARTALALLTAKMSPTDIAEAKRRLVR
jgi:TPR repeat protein